MNAQAIVVLALKVSIILTMFGFGLHATREDMLYVLRRPGLLLKSLIAMFVVMPIFAILLTRVGSFNRAVAIALIALSISPIPPLLPKRVTKSGGLAPYGLGLMVTAATLSIGFIPLASYLLGKYFNRPFAMDPLHVAKVVGFSVLIPLALGMLFRKFAPALAERIGDPLLRIAGIILVLGVLCILAVALRPALSLIGDGTILAFVVFVLVGLAVGHVLGGPEPDSRVTLALSTACRHPALALAIAASNVPSEHHVLSAILLYLIVNIVFTIPYVVWQRKKAKSQLVTS